MGMFSWYQLSNVNPNSIMTTLSSIPWYSEYYKSNVNLQFVNWYYYRVCEDWVNIHRVILKDCQKFTFAISFGQKLQFPDEMED